jgi:hypothetical protein
VNLTIGGRKPALALAATVVAALSAGPALAQEPATAGGREHVVRKGDTLWDLAKFYMSDPFQWGQIFEANRGKVSNPHRIFPNWRLVIPPSLAADAAAGAGAEGGELAYKASAPDRTRFYRGEEGTRASAGAEATFLAGEEVRPLAVQPGEFYSAPWLSDRSDLKALGSVVRVKGRESGGIDPMSQSVHPFDRVYVRYEGRTRLQAGEKLLLVHEGRRLAGWGRVIEPVAIGTVESLDKDVMTVAVTEQFDRVRPGDLALAFTEFPGSASGEATPVENGAAAELLGFAEERPIYALADVAFIALGRKQGIAIGDELAVYLPERASGRFGAPQLPREEIARLRVVRADERSATVRFLTLEQASLKPGLPVRLVGKRD